MSAYTKTFAIVTFGCKLNQYESECIRRSLLRDDWKDEPFERGAQFYIINSCTVTGKSDSRSRNAARRAKRISPDSFVIVTGCYAETQPHVLEEIPEIDLVLGNRYKGKIPVIMNSILNGERVEAAVNTPDGGRYELVPIEKFHGHSRAFIKVQEGCNESCSYCIIPRARGKSRSVPPDDVLHQVRMLLENGYQEIVLTGIHIGRYGADLRPRLTLTDLIEMLLAKTGVPRIRLSSIEVTEVTPDLVALVAGNDRVAPHLHVPLQSGDDDILAAMNRPYRTHAFREKIEDIYRAGEGIAIGTDIIVGFPGETDAHFRNTYEFVDRLPFSYFHVFTFSSRPGTRAETMPDQVTAEDRKKRSARLIKLGREKKRSFMRSLIGTSTIALVQGPMHRFSQFQRTLTGNYCEVFVRSTAEMIGKLAAVHVTHYSKGQLYGTVASAFTGNRTGA